MNEAVDTDDVGDPSKPRMIMVLEMLLSPGSDVGNVPKDGKMIGKGTREAGKTRVLTILEIQGNPVLNGVVDAAKPRTLKVSDMLLSLGW